MFTDIEGSTRLWEEHPVEMQVALARHDELVRSIVESADGKLVRDSKALAPDEEVKLTFAQGWATAQVKDKG